MGEFQEVGDRRTSRGRFMRQVGLGVFAAVPVMKALALPGAAAAGGDPPDCEYQTCTYDGHNCCSNHHVGDEYACYDNFTHDFCGYQCVTGSLTC